MSLLWSDDPGVANIFSRITGSNPSAIFGTLGLKGGDANLVWRSHKGANIEIVANDIFLTADSSINADSDSGIDDTVKVKTLLNTERNNLTQLPQHAVRADNKVTRSCSNNGDR